MLQFFWKLIVKSKITRGLVDNASFFSVVKNHTWSAIDLNTFDLIKIIEWKFPEEINVSDDLTKEGQVLIFSCKPKNMDWRLAILKLKWCFSDFSSDTSRNFWQVEVYWT